MKSFKGDWVTSMPGSLKAYWPRRDTKFTEGPPKATNHYSVGELSAMRIVGIYLDEDIEEGLVSRPLLKRPQ